MPLLVLKIDADTRRGTRDGVPRLMRLLQRHAVPASFLFSLGPDHTGWAWRRVLQPGFVGKASRTSVLAHYGWATLMYGVLLPAPDIGRSCAAALRAVRDAGFECGVHAWDHVLWQDNVRRRDAAWTMRQMRLAHDRFREIFGAAPLVHGAAGWQMNSASYAGLDALGYACASDGRCRLRPDGNLADPAAGPYRLRLAGATLRCPQLPTTLPTMDEMLGREIGGVRIDASNIAAALLALTEIPRDHVFTLHAELEGQRLAPAFAQLLAGWHSQGYTFGTLGSYQRSLATAELPLRDAGWTVLPGRGAELASWKMA